jgi:phage gpG-like protein
MITLNVSLEGEKQLSRRLMTIPNDIDNWKIPLFRIGGEVRGAIDKNFSSRGALFGARWQPRKDNLPHPLLEKTTTMRRNFKQSLGPDYIEIFNPTPYFKYHQSNKPRRKIPRRVMMKIDDERKRFIQREFQKHINDALRKGSTE